MFLILLISIGLRVLALGWSIVIIRKLRDWRLGFFSVMLVLMAARQGWTLLALTEQSGVVSEPLRELPGLLVSIMAFFALFFLQRIIARQQATARQLEASEKSLQRAQKLARLGTFEWDIPGNMVQWSQGLYDIYGLKPQEFRATVEAFVEQVHPDDRERVQGAIQQAIEKTGSFQIQERIVRPDGEVRFLSTMGEVERSAEGEPLRLIGICLDVTEQKTAEERLRQEMERNREILATTLDGYILADVDGRLIEVNPSYCRMTGYSRAELLKMNIRDLERSLRPEEIPARIQKMLAEGHARFETRHLHKEGRLIDLDVSIVVMKEAGHPLVAAFVRDITEQKTAQDRIARAKEQLDLALRGARMGIWEWNIQTNEVNWSDEVEGIFGLAPGSFEGTYEAYLRLVPEEDQQRVAEAVEKSLGDGAEYHVEHRLFPADGKMRWIEGKGMLLKDEEGKAVRMLGTVVDITDRKRSEDALRESEMLFRMLSRVSPVGIFRTDPEGNGIYVNEQLEKMTGLSAEKLSGRGWVTAIHPEDRERVQRGWMRTIEGENDFKAEFRFVTPHGEETWVVAEAQRISTADGHSAGYVGAVTDISNYKRIEKELQASEAHSRILFDYSAIVIWEEDFSEIRCYLKELQGQGIKDFRTYFSEHPEEIRSVAEKVKIIDVNQKSLEFYGARDREELILSLPSYFVEGSWDVLAEEIAALAEGATHFESEIPIRTPGGDLKTLLLSLSIPPVYRDTWESVLVSFIDISDRKNAEAALMQSARRYQALFDENPTPLWEEDFSNLKAYIDDLRNKGVTDFREYCHQHSDELLSCAAMVKILEVNKAALALHGAQSKEDLLSGLSRLFTDLSYDAFREQVIAIAEGRTRLTLESEVHTLKGERVFILLDWAVVPGHEKDYSRVFLSTVDVTERKHNEETILRSNKELSVLLKVSQNLVAQFDLQKLLMRIPAYVVEALDRAQASTLWLIDENTGLIEPVGWEGHRTAEIRRLALDPETSLIGLLLRTEKPLLINDVSKTPHFRQIGKPRMDSVKAVIGVPIVIEKHCIGGLFADNFSAAGAFEENDVRLLQWLGNQAALAIKSARLFQKQRESEEQLRRSQEQLRALTAHLQSVREEERLLIAREMHDELGQVLTALKMDIAMIGRDFREQFPGEGSRSIVDELKGMTNLVDATIQRVRKMITELRPEVLDNLGLVAALEWQFEEFRKRTGIKCRFKSEMEEIELDQERAIALFRIYQEALTNIARHAQAKKMKVSLALQGDRILLKIVDDGIGIPADKLESDSTFGLLGMRERALVFGGEVLISGTPGKGTVVRVHLPVGQAQATLKARN